MTRTAIQMVGFLILASVLGLSWNSVSGDGITIDRKHIRPAKADAGEPEPKGIDRLVIDEEIESKDIEPKDTGSEPAAGIDSPPENGNVDSSPAGTVEEDVWMEEGLQFCGLKFAREAYETYNDEIYYFIDARKREEYDEGHVPTAFSLNQYRADQLIGAIQNQLEERPMHIVYCGGGDCEDSIYLATALAEEFDFDPETIYVFKGGMEEWEANKLPVAEGEERGDWQPLPVKSSTP